MGYFNKEKLKKLPVSDLISILTSYHISHPTNEELEMLGTDLANATDEAIDAWAERAARITELEYVISAKLKSLDF